MPAINFPRTYTNTGGLAARRKARSRRYPAADRVNITNGKFHIGAKRFRWMGCALVEAAALQKDDTELRATMQRIAAEGHNVVRLRSWTDRSWDDTALNWGMWKYAEDTPLQADKWLIHENALAQIDKAIAYALEAGIELVYIDIEGWQDVLRRHPTPRPEGCFEGRGMWWSPLFRDMMWDSTRRILEHEGALIGCRIIDHPRVVVMVSNECGFGNSYLRTDTKTWRSPVIVGSNVFNNDTLTLPNTVGVYVGMAASGTGVPGGSTVLAKTSTTVQLSAVCSSGGAGRSFTFRHTGTYFSKIIKRMVDTTGDNAFWMDDATHGINPKFLSWAASAYPAWTVPAWGPGGEACLPETAALQAWGTQSDRDKVIEWASTVDVEVIVDHLTRLRALNDDCVVCLGTWGYHSPLAYTKIPLLLKKNLCIEIHGYFNDDTGGDDKEGSAVTRRSIFSSTWSYGKNGGPWQIGYQGQRTADLALIDGEIGQYSWNRRKYERPIYGAIMCLLHEIEYCTAHEGQQHIEFQTLCDGRPQQNDHSNVADQTLRLCNRALGPCIEHGFLTPFGSSFTINFTEASLLALQKAKNSATISPHHLNDTITGMPAGNYLLGGREHAHLGGKQIYCSIDNANTPTTDWTGYPAVTDTTLDAGYEVRNTATEKFWVRNDVGSELMTPYWVNYCNTINDTPHFSEMPVKARDLTGAITVGFLNCRSDEEGVELFQGPGLITIAGGSYSLEMLNKGNNGGTHQTGTPGQFGTNNPPGEAYALANDSVTVYHMAPAGQSQSKTWSSGGASDQRTNMPAPFWVDLDTTNNGRFPAGQEQVIYQVGLLGNVIPVASTYDSGTKVQSFYYDATLPEYLYHPKPKVRVSHGRTARGR